MRMTAEKVELRCDVYDAMSWRTCSTSFCSSYVINMSNKKAENHHIHVGTEDVTQTFL